MVGKQKGLFTQIIYAGTMSYYIYLSKGWSNVYWLNE